MNSGAIACWVGGEVKTGLSRGWSPGRVASPLERIRPRDRSGNGWAYLLPNAILSDRVNGEQPFIDQTELGG